MSKIRAMVGLGIGSVALAWLVGGDLAATGAQDPRAEKGKVTAEDEAHFRLLQKARRELQILEAQVALKKAEIQRAEAEYMLRRLRESDEVGDPKVPEPAAPGPATKKGGSEDGPVHDALERALVMPFPDATPLEEVLRYVKDATRRPGLPDGLPVFVDPEALKAAGRSMESRVTICHDGLTLRKALETALEPIGLDLHVKDGLVVIGARATASKAKQAEDEPG